MEITPLGDSALIVRVVDDFARDPDGALCAVLDVLRRLATAKLSGVLELAPSYATVAVYFDPTRIAVEREASSPFTRLSLQIQDALGAKEKASQKETKSRLIEIPVCYDRDFALDLDEVALRSKLSADEVARLHSAASYRVNCIGFTPGFPYLSGLPSELATPRRDAPRKEVPSGSVAIGGGQTGIYPRNSPGGWNVIGRTPLRLFDVQKNPPSRLQTGDHVRFRQITLEEFEVYSE